MISAEAVRHHTYYSALTSLHICCAITEISAILSSQRYGQYFFFRPLGGDYYPDNEYPPIQFPLLSVFPIRYLVHRYLERTINSYKPAETAAQQTNPTYFVANLAKGEFLLHLITKVSLQVTPTCTPYTEESVCSIPCTEESVPLRAQKTCTEESVCSTPCTEESVPPHAQKRVSAPPRAQKRVSTPPRAPRRVSAPPRAQRRVSVPPFAQRRARGIRV